MGKLHQKVYVSYFKTLMKTFCCVCGFFLDLGHVKMLTKNVAVYVLGESDGLHA